jgi:amidophosphoribosyltransferase
MAREAGARKVYFASAAPPVRFPNVYGIDIPTSTELVAYNRTEEEVAAVIGADWLIYQDVDALVDAARAGNPEITEFDTSCFTGHYVTGDVSADYLAHISFMRNDDNKSKRDSNDEMVLDLSNNG